MNIVGEAKKKEIATNRRMDRTNVGGAADAPPPGIEIPELQPTRFDVEDAEGIRAHLKDYGFVAIKDVAGEAELDHARGLLWSHLGEHGWVEGQPRTYTDAAYQAKSLTPNNAGGNVSAGTMGSTAHSDCLWYVRSLPGVLRAYDAAYGTADLVASFDRMSINRPSCVRPSPPSLPRAHPDAFSFCRRLAGPAARRA